MDARQVDARERTSLISVATAPTAFADLVGRLAGEPRTKALIARRRAFAAEHSQARRAADIGAAKTPARTAQVTG